MKHFITKRYGPFYESTWFSCNSCLSVETNDEELSESLAKSSVQFSNMFTNTQKALGTPSHRQSNQNALYAMTTCRRICVPALRVYYVYFRYLRTCAICQLPRVPWKKVQIHVIHVRQNSSHTGDRSVFGPINI